MTSGLLIKSSLRVRVMAWGLIALMVLCGASGARAFLCIGEEGHVEINPAASHGCCEPAHDAAEAAAPYSYADESAAADSVHDDDCCIDIPIFTDWGVQPARARRDFTLRAQTAPCGLDHHSFPGQTCFGEPAARHFPVPDLPLVHLRTVVLRH